jgi:hypothetical protein
MSQRRRRIVQSRRSPLVTWLPPMRTGNRPVDGGALAGISAQEAERISQTDQVAAKFLRPYVGSDELRKGREAWCLWLSGIEPDVVRSSPELEARVERVRAFRSSSAQERVRAGVARPHEFLEIRQQPSACIALPRTVPSSWSHIPSFELVDGTVAKNNVNVIESLDPLIIGYLNSRAFALWCDAVSSEGGSGRNLPPSSTYNTFPFPELGEDDENIKDAARALLLARSYHLKGTLDDLYQNPEETPDPVKKAHSMLDGAVAKAFGIDASASDEEVLEALFSRYEALLAPGPEVPPAQENAA